MTIVPIVCGIASEFWSALQILEKLGIKGHAQQILVVLVLIAVVGVSWLVLTGSAETFGAIVFVRDARDNDKLLPLIDVIYTYFIGVEKAISVDALTDSGGRLQFEVPTACANQWVWLDVNRRSSSVYEYKRDSLLVPTSHPHDVYLKRKSPAKQ